VGRQRQGNEDNFFVQSPLFVVADGMGGAQAGEVASELAVEAFRSGLPDGSPEQGLTELIRAANRRIFDTAREDAQRQGMGTTCTAAYVAEDEVVVAHVGDSRCYLLRQGELTRLTRDHSLVGELVDRGKLTEEQAETHPQRSVITRALGPEPEVRVDTERVAARAGDAFLLCSDGLTSMVREADVAGILRDAGSLEQAGRELIAAANAAGGRDNITVVLFSVEEVEARSGASTEDSTAEQAAVGGEAGGYGATDSQEAAYREQATATLAAVRPEPRAAPPPRRTAPPLAPRRPPAPPGGRRSKLAKCLIVIGVLLVMIGVSAWVAIRAVFFIGLDSHRAVTIYRGVPYTLPGGIRLYTRDYTSGVTISEVPAARRRTFTDHKLRSNSDAQDLVRQLELGTIRR
jgi:protein phosphatase